MKIGPAQPKSYTRYHLHVVNASGIIWESSLLFGKPSPFIEIWLGGQQIYTTATTLIYSSAAKSRTITPVWDERLEFKSNDSTSILSINLRRKSMTPGLTRSIGSAQIKIQDLEELGIFSPDISLDLYEMGKKTASVTIRFKKDDPPPVAKPSVPANVAPELRPDFVPPRHPYFNEKKLQIVGYQSQDVSMDQIERIVRQVLARSSAENSDPGNI